MKKTLIALAAVAVSSAAMAQVTISGAIGFGIQKDDGVTTQGRTDGNVNFSATEDLGGGLKATVVGGVDLPDRGSAANGRNISLTVSGGFGTVAFANVNSASSTRLSGAGGAISLNTADIDDVYGADTNNVDTLTYTLPTLVQGLTVSYGFNSTAGASMASTSGDLGLTYAAGPARTTLTYRQNDGRTRLSGSYNFGVASVGFGYIPAFGTQAADQIEYEVWAPMGPITIGYQSAERGASEGTAYGVKYDLSKRTNIVISRGEILGKTYQRAKIVHSF
jgi:predicted porin